MRFLNCCRWFYALPIFDSSFYFLFKLQFQMDFFLDDFEFLGMSYRIYALTLHYTFNNKKWMFINDRWRIGTGIIIASRINHTTKSVFNTFLSLSFCGFCVKWFRFRFFTCDNFFSLAQSKAFTWTLGHTKSNTFFCWDTVSRNRFEILYFGQQLIQFGIIIVTVTHAVWIIIQNIDEFWLKMCKMKFT